MSLEHQLASISYQDLESVIREQVKSGYLRLPLSAQADARLHNQLFDDWPALYGLPHMIMRALLDQPDSIAHREEDRKLLVAGAELMILALDSLVRATAGLDDRRPAD